MKTNDWLWDELHNLFDTDDGSLPEIQLHFSTSEAMVEAYTCLRERALEAIPKDAHFWSNTLSEDRLLSSVSNPAALVASGETSAFHVVLRGIESTGVTIPDIGVFVFADKLVLDYRMGSHWKAPQLVAFFELLSEISNLDPRSFLSLETGAPPNILVRFQEAWSKFSAKRSRTFC